MKYKGTLIGLAPDGAEYSVLDATVRDITLSPSRLVFSMSYNNFEHLCELKAIHGHDGAYEGLWKCGSQAGDIRGRVLRDKIGIVFVGTLIDEERYKICIDAYPE